MKAFIFDMDGVILDSEPIHFDVDFMTLEHFGVNINREELEKYVGMTNPEMWGFIKKDYNIPQTVAEIIEYQLKHKIEVLKKSNIQPIEGIMDLINELQMHRIPIAIASSSPRVFIEAVLEKFRIIDHFVCVVSGEEVNKGKPAPDVYMEAARLLGVEPRECVVIEDSKHGVMAAKAAGMKCIGYINLNSGNQNLSQADIIVRTIHEIRVEDFL